MGTSTFLTDDIKWRIKTISANNDKKENSFGRNSGDKSKAENSIKNKTLTLWGPFLNLDNDAVILKFSVGQLRRRGLNR